MDILTEEENKVWDDWMKKQQKVVEKKVIINLKDLQKEKHAEKDNKAEESNKGQLV